MKTVQASTEMAATNVTAIEIAKQSERLATKLVTKQHSVYSTEQKLDIIH
jgi:hypothetical protein